MSVIEDFNESDFEEELAALDNNTAPNHHGDQQKQNGDNIIKILFSFY